MSEPVDPTLPSALEVGAAENPALEAAAAQRGLGRDTVVYAIGFVAQRVGSLVMLPITTRSLTPSEYGLMFLLVLLGDAAVILTSEGTTAGFFRYYYAATDRREQGEIVTASVALLLAQNALGALVLFTLAPQLLAFAFHGAGSVGLIRELSVVILLGALVPVPLLLMQALRRSGLYTLVTVGQLCVGLGLNALFLLKLRLGVAGLLLSTGVTFVVVGLPACVWMFRQLPLRWSTARAMQLRRFGLPYQLAMFAMFILNYGDRFFLQHYRTTAETGLYSLAYQFGFVMWSLSAASFFQAWSPAAYRLAELPAPEREQSFNDGLLAATCVTAVAAVGMAVSIRPLLTVVSSQSYVAAAQIAPLVLIAFTWQAWYPVFKAPMDITGKTAHIPRLNWVTALLTLSCYWLFIPRLGAVGAALATIVGFVARSLISYRLGRDLLPIRWRLGAPTSMLLAATAVLVLLTLFPVPTFRLQLVVAAATTLAFAGFVWLVPLEARHRQYVLAIVRRVAGMATAVLTRRAAGSAAGRTA